MKKAVRSPGETLESLAQVACLLSVKRHRCVLRNEAVKWVPGSLETEEGSPMGNTHRGAKNVCTRLVFIFCWWCILSIAILIPFFDF